MPELSFRAFLVERWGRVLLTSIAWGLVVFVLLPRLPQWFSGLVYLFVFGSVGYFWGEANERKRQIDVAIKFDRDISELLAKIHDVTRLVNERKDLN